MILPQDFYSRDTIEVAREILGKRLVRLLPSGQRVAGRIVECEAYLGVEDPAAHTFGGRRTARNEAMYGAPGFSYVYFVYGMHHCINVVTQRPDVPEAVLIRALEPVEGLPKQFSNHPHKWLNGPAKLCSGLEITRDWNALPLFENRTKLWIEDDKSVSEADIVVGRRVGVEYAGDAAYWPLQFGVRGHPGISGAKFDP